MRRRERLQPGIEYFVTERLGAMAQISGPVHPLRQIALPMLAQTTRELLGVPYADRAPRPAFSTVRFDLGYGANAPLDANNESNADLGA